jgi:hypothetical protein
MGDPKAAHFRVDADSDEAVRGALITSAGAAVWPLPPLPKAEPAPKKEAPPAAAAVAAQEFPAVRTEAPAQLEASPDANVTAFKATLKTSSIRTEARKALKAFRAVMMKVINKPSKIVKSLAKKADAACGKMCGFKCNVKLLESASTSTHAQIKRLTFREATQAEAQATLDAQAALKPR